jgi:tRNA threonylcarbamoyladenosine biosynthesis protein TsaB
MDYILNIHTTTEKAIVNICNGQNVINTYYNYDPKEHLAFLHSGIQKILKENKILINELKAVGVTSGPGSYTGIRIGLATAKGLCFSLKIPLISFNTLEVMARSAAENIQQQNALYCPMIDARRLEVFTAVFDYAMQEVIPPSAMVLTEESFTELLNSNPIYFFGNGSKKFEILATKIQQSHFIDEEINPGVLCKFGWEKYQKKEFADVAIAEPFYIKEFHSTLKK